MLALSPVVAALVLPGLALAQQSSTSYGGIFIECPAGLNIVRHAGVVAVNQTISPEVTFCISDFFLVNNADISSR